MIRPRLSAFVASFALVLPGILHADHWDNQFQNDDSVATENELVHGSDQLHDLALQGAAYDDDWYRLRQEPRASYEVVVELGTGDILLGPYMLTRRDASGQSVLQISQSVSPSIDRNLSLRWENTAATPQQDDRIIMGGIYCGGCDTNDVYRIRSLETTYAIPRFNNTASQATVVLLQNPTAYLVQGTLWFWNGSGSLVTSRTFSLSPKMVLTLNTALDPALAGVSGSITVTNDARYGELAGKAVSVEPATGYSFDTPMMPRPH